MKEEGLSLTHSEKRVDRIRCTQKMRPRKFRLKLLKIEVKKKRSIMSKDVIV